MQYVSLESYYRLVMVSEYTIVTLFGPIYRAISRKKKFKFTLLHNNKNYIFGI